MSEMFLRTEDIREEDVLDLLVETTADRLVIDRLKEVAPFVLRGSRGVGKSFLLRAAQAELTNDLSKDGNLPVYLSYAYSPVINPASEDQFRIWMMAKLCVEVGRAMTATGIAAPARGGFDALLGSSDDGPSRLELVERDLENAWQRGPNRRATQSIPDPQDLRDAVKTACRQSGLQRVTLLVDEAAHVFIPEQQRQFFTLMRSIRSPYLAVKAAVYPGTTAYGDYFQPGHDAAIVNLDRSVMDQRYLGAMRTIVVKQNPSLSRSIGDHGEAFDALAFAASGNPRALLETVNGRNFNVRRAEETIREHYRGAILERHSDLASRYVGHRRLIDWGREFLEADVLPRLYDRSKRLEDQYAFILIHRDAPQAVRFALQLLCYSGLLQEGASGVRSRAGELGTRYLVNLGCQIAFDPSPVSFATQLRRGLSAQRMIDYGASDDTYARVSDINADFVRSPISRALQARLKTSHDVLKITSYQRAKLKEMGFVTIGDILQADETKFTKAPFVGPKRARQIREAAVAAVLEYLSG